MATYSETLAARQEVHLRPFDARRDLGPVADLVELCFAETLDRDGREYLGRMRSAARSSTWLGWAAKAEWSTPAMGGFVWQEGSRLIGNVSLIPYFVKGRRFFLIANVAVHPDYRRRGIARKLTHEAIEFARRRQSPSVWLHVREDNAAAVQLYRDLGFAERARRTSWHSQALYQPGELEPGEHIASPPGRSWPQMRQWLQRDYPPELSWHMPLNVRALHPGLMGELYRLLYGASLRQWALMRGSQVLCSVAWQPMAGHASAVWLAAPADCPPRIVQTLLSAVRQNLPSIRPLALDYPARSQVDALRLSGFAPGQTLIWMELGLT